MPLKIENQKTRNIYDLHPSLWEYEQAFHKIIIKTNIEKYECITFKRGKVVFDGYTDYIQISLGSPKTVYSIYSLSKKHKLYAYNEEKMILTLKINCFVTVNPIKERFHIKDGLLAIFLKSKMNKRVVKYLRNLQSKKLIQPIIEKEDSSCNIL